MTEVRSADRAVRRKRRRSRRLELFKIHLRHAAADARRAFLPRETLSIAAIFKNEGPYVIEWVAWHRCLGIRSFFIADNNSDDGTTRLLAALDRAGIVRHIPFPGQPGVAPQLPAYGQIMKSHETETEWMAFIDADEFIRPSPRLGQARNAVQAWLRKRPRWVGAVALNWAVYGSSHRTEPGDGLVTERFTLRGDQNFKENRHIKTIMRCRDWRGLVGSPHHFAVAAGRSYADSQGDLFVNRGIDFAIAEKVVWGDIRLDHYVIKSRSEFILKKVARGRADTLAAEHLRTMNFFAEHDMNDVSDPPDPAFMAEVKAEVARLAKLVPDIPERR